MTSGATKPCTPSEQSRKRSPDRRSEKWLSRSSSAADGPGDHIGLRMGAGLGGLQLATLDELLNHAVVPGALGQLTIAQAIEAAVARP